MNSVAGEEAAGYDAVSLFDFTAVNKGPLVSADVTTGAVSWVDVSGETRTATLGAHAIRILKKTGYGR